jgi:hypothetical protein
VQSVTLRIKGLYTGDNDLGSVPEGALTKATNIAIDRADIAEPRRGFDRLTGSFTDTDARAERLWTYQGKVFVHLSNGKIAYHDGSAWQESAASYTAPTDGKVYQAEANQNLYVTTSTGIKKLSSYSSAPVDAGGYKALDVQASLITTTPKWLANNYRTAYRVLWGYKDANNNLILGAPSPRESIKNTAGATFDRSVQLSVAIPSGVTTAWFCQVYRSAAVDNSGGDTEPSDEMQLVYEANPSSGDITAGSMTISDITPDELRGATLYTSPSQEGIANGNEKPPLAKDIAVFKNHTFYLNTTSKHRYTLTLIAVNVAGSPTTGVTANDTIVIGGVTYTAKATENVANREFAVSVSSSASIAIRETAVSLVRVINRSATSTVYAYYLSGPTDLPGKILLEERSIGGGSFAVTSSRATCWTPNLPSSGTTESSSNDEYKNGLRFSKDGQPEAVPLPNFFQVGSKDKAGLRAIPLRDSLFILKEDGIYRVTGEGASSFSVSLLDSSAKLLAPETCAVLNNQIFCLTDQGVVTISDTGVSVISRAIEPDILGLTTEDLAGVRDYSFGVSYESDRKYLLFMISAAGDTWATQAFVYNTFTSTWVRWELSKTAGVVNQEDDKLYLADALSSYVNQERKTRTFTDQVDFGFTSTVTAVSGLTVTLDSGTDQIAAGDILYQSASVFSFVDSVDVVTGDVTVTVESAFTVGAVTIYKAIATEIEWTPATLGNPAALKQDHTVILLFKSDFTGTGTATFKSDLSVAEETVSFSGAGLGLWGMFAWGSVPWGGTNQRRAARTYVPLNKQVNSQLTVGFRHATGFGAWQLTGVSVIGEPGGEEVSR